MSNTYTNDQIVENLVKIKLTVAGWWGKAKARKIAREAEEKHNSKHGIVQAQVQSLADEYRKPLVELRSEAYELMYARTRRWDDGGWRVVSVEDYVKLMDDIADLQSRFEDAVNKFLSKYDEALATAKRDLNGMYDDSMFPSRSELEAKYRLEVFKDVVTPVGDIRLGALSDHASQQLRREIEGAYRVKIEDAMKETVDSLRDLARDCYERTSRDPKGVKFATLIPKIKLAIETLPALNITADPKIAQVIKDVTAKLDGYDEKELRANAGVRIELRNKAKSILDDIEASFGKGA